MTPFWPDGQAVDMQTAGDAPLAFRWNRRRHRVRHVSARWRVHTQWWADAEVWRDYWEVITDTGLLCVVFRDLLSGRWFLERIYE